MMFNHFLGRRGYTLMRVFSILCPISKTIIKDGVTSQEEAKEQEIHASQEEQFEISSSFFYLIWRRSKRHGIQLMRSNHFSHKLKSFWYVCLQILGSLQRLMGIFQNKFNAWQSKKRTKKEKTTLNIDSKQSLSHNIPSFFNKYWQ